MPNWCSNNLEVKGPADKVEEFVSKFKSNGFSAFLPTPQELLDHSSPLEDKSLKEEFIKKYGAEDWYHWNIANWGTKWDVLPDEVYITGNDNDRTIMFDTAWSPPSEFLSAVSKMYPELTFILQYEEPGMGFFGEAKWENGEMLYDDCYEWGQRFTDGWYLYENMIDPIEEAYSMLDEFPNMDEETYKQVEEVIESYKIDKNEINGLLEALSSLEIDEVKDFLKEQKSLNKTLKGVSNV